MLRLQNPWSHVFVAGVLVLLGLIACHVPEARAQEEGPTLPEPEPALRQEYVRVTFYVLRGYMASGIWTRPGAAACSYGYPMGTQLVMPDGYVVTCLDRGLLGRDTGWVDIWAPSMAWGRRYVAQDYGNHAWVTVQRWGWE